MDCLQCDDHGDKVHVYTSAPSVLRVRRIGTPAAGPPGQAPVRLASGPAGRQADLCSVLTMFSDFSGDSTRPWPREET